MIGDRPASIVPGFDRSEPDEDRTQALPVRVSGDPKPPPGPARPPIAETQVLPADPTQAVDQTRTDDPGKR